MMRFRIHLALLLMAGVASLGAESVCPATSKATAVATLTSRSAKPGDRLELVLTVRGLNAPVVGPIGHPADLKISPLRRGKRLMTEDGAVVLFRYRVRPTKVGDCIIDPITVTGGEGMLVTAPIRLHVSRIASRMPMEGEELSRAVAIPKSLADEVIRAVPQPSPSPEPVKPTDDRPLPIRFLSIAGKALSAFWNYPGKSGENP